MATTYTQVVANKLVLTDTYKELMKASIGQGSAYLKAKETVNQLLKDSTIKDTDKALLISNMIVGITNTITTKAMDMAYAVEKDKRDAPYELTKMKEDTRLVTAQISKIEKDDLKAEAEKNLTIMAGWKTQAELLRDFGANTSTLSTATTIVPSNVFTETGTKVETIKMSQASRYNTYASSFRSNGYVSVPLNADGTLSVNATGDNNGLVTAQTAVAVRQKEGFDDNMRQHVANSSASMISLLLSTEAGGIDYTPYLASWSGATNYLNTTKLATAGSILNNLPPVSISKAAGQTLAGTTISILPGVSVVVKLYSTTAVAGEIHASSEVVALVQQDGTWSANFSTVVLAGLPVGTYDIIAKVMDATGNTRTDTDSTTLVA